MSKSKYHVSIDGVVRKCMASTPERCTAEKADGVEGHFESPADGQRAFEEKQSGNVIPTIAVADHQTEEDAREEELEYTYESLSIHIDMSNRILADDYSMGDSDELDRVGGFLNRAKSDLSFMKTYGSMKHDELQENKERIGATEISLNTRRIQNLGIVRESLLKDMEGESKHSSSFIRNKKELEAVKKEQENFVRKSLNEIENGNVTDEGSLRNLTKEMKKLEGPLRANDRITLANSCGEVSRSIAESKARRYERAEGWKSSNKESVEKARKKLDAAKEEFESVSKHENSLSIDELKMNSNKLEDLEIGVIHEETKIDRDTILNAQKAERSAMKRDDEESAIRSRHEIRVASRRINMNKDALDKIVSLSEGRISIDKADKDFRRLLRRSSSV